MRCLKQLPQRIHFDRISERRSGAVRLDVADVAGGDSSIVQRTRDESSLRRPVRHRQSAASTVLVDGRATNHG